VAVCDVRIEAVLKRFRKTSSVPVGKLPPVRTPKKQGNDLNFNVRAALHGLLGCDVTQIHGLGPYLALKLVGECGTNLSAWPNAKHFTSWLCLSPSSKISGGKVLSSRTRRSGSRAAALTAACRGRRRTHGHRVGGILPTAVRACWQGHCDGPQDRCFVLQYPTPWYGIQRSGSLSVGCGRCDD
jgi:Transposase IS116/IS110/IS902 family